MRHRSDKTIAEDIANDPRTRHLTPEQRQILIAETLQLIKKMRADFRLRHKPPKPPKQRKPRQPRRAKFSALELIVAAHMHRCRMTWLEINALLGYGQHSYLRERVKLAGLRTTKFPKPPKPPRIPKPAKPAPIPKPPRSAAPIPRPPKSSRVKIGGFDVTPKPPRLPKPRGKPRRFDWARALEMRNAGISNLEIAEWAGVTPEAVCMAIKKMKKAVEAATPAA